MQLTVAIPTFNRNAVLRETLTRLLPQLTPQCRLLIVDNHSTTPVEDTVRGQLQQYPRIDCQVVRNRCNVGGAANILRCFEACETEWMWLYGDDDHPTSNAVETILQTITRHPESLLLHFGTPAYRHSSSFSTRGLSEFVRGSYSWSHLNFMSAGVYNCRVLQPQLRFGHYFAYSLSPHAALLLSSIGDSGQCWFSDESVISFQAPAEWAEVNALLGKMTLLELLPDEAIRRDFAAKLSCKPSLEAVTAILTKTGFESSRQGQELFQYDQICARIFYYNRSLLSRLRIPLYRLLVRWPAIGFPLLQSAFPWLARLLGYGHMQLNQISCPDRFARA